MMGVDKGHVGIVKVLLKYRADTNIVTTAGLKALDFSKVEEVTALLRELGGKSSLGKRRRDSNAEIISITVQDTKNTMDEQVKRNTTKHSACIFKTKFQN